MANLGVIEFGQQLLDTRDLDPVYIMLHHAQLPLAQRERWCTAYWLYYHSGTASRLSELTGKHFWQECKAVFPTTPRGTERRHFRTQAARSALDWLAEHYVCPEEFVSNLCPCSHHTKFQDLAECAQQAPLFGPWIAFKICDMMERVLERKVDFSGCDLFFYKDPLRGAELAAAHLGLATPTEAVYHLLKVFGKQKAPPDYKRRINLQEIETILCKYKSHLNGHYPIGKDTHEVGHALKQFPCKTSDRLLECLEANTKCTRRVALF